MSDQQAIEAVVHLYVEGMTFANEAALRKAFHPQCDIIGHYENAVEWLNREEFIAAIVAEGSAPPTTQPHMDIQMLDVVGDAACVKVSDDFAGMRFTDYLSMLKIEGRWMIVNKLYYLHT
ncbi:nuclear transport factor 2 family protein [Rhizobium sp. YTU87027]|uniref:nuclear transport factor 2 family protein n=1 Tax=Rhizobium sp. YTU87027 TaxID=3417741 RepID=UPI003D684B65